MDVNRGEKWAPMFVFEFTEKDPDLGPSVILSRAVVLGGFGCNFSEIKRFGNEIPSRPPGKNQSCWSMLW